MPAKAQPEEPKDIFSDVAALSKSVEEIAPSDEGCGCVVTGPQSRGLKPGGLLLALGCLMLFVRLRKVRYNGL